MGSYEEEVESETTDNATPVPDVITTYLSHMYTMDGKPRAASLELQGFLGKSEVLILVDTGSTHNFLHPRVAEKIQLPLHAIQPFRVYVGNGQSLLCANMSPRVELRIQGHSFTLDLYILPVHGPDVILGMSWLRSFHRVTSDYDAGTMEFENNGHPICLKVLSHSPRQVSVRTFAAIMLHHGAADLFEIVPIETAGDVHSAEVDFPPNLPPEVHGVLEEHKAVFELPTGMLPPRPFDHRIHLLPNTRPVNVRPYRYPNFQKNEIEKQVHEMLEVRIIRRSQSAFSSPVLLIRK